MILEKYISYLRLIKRGYLTYKHNDKPIKMGKRIALIASGPDAQIYFKNRERFNDYDVLVMNSYPVKNSDFFELKPKFYAVLDPIYFKPSTKAYNGHLSDEILRLHKILNKVDWPLYIIVNGDSKLPIDNTHIKYIRMGYGLTLPYCMENYQKRLVIKNIALPNSQTVMVHALLFAEIFGYEEIAIFGLNMNELQNLRNDIDNNLWFDHEHFYGKAKSIILPYSYIDEIKYVLAMLEGFEAVAEIANFLNVTIKNYSVNSYVQSFVKERLE